MKESWEAETSIENWEPLDSLIISLKETLEEENYSGDLPAPLE
jgi:hypothetical protein